ncbi:hypothetical protein PGH07_04400 [Sulfurovum sp. zt1-1]|uniref:Uncharacterized protein n=1 Tax=Sulfurovum zhangzhouensis TaxID=3019067 RepID=A0ABT7QX47_9BACT|nr:hypothetical protein [Sulfurovum zhangzhouensis]MDM5271409.1 hypothetical protein [Sulfurovum zhangzhouensis]
MDWITILEIIAMILTVVILFALLKELKKNIKDSNNGKKNERCDLD